MVNCICATDVLCQNPVAIYEINNILSPDFTFTPVYIVPGAIAGCSVIDSLLLSTLECYYSDSVCFSIILNYLKENYFKRTLLPSWFDPRPLTFDSKLSRYPPNTPVSVIVKNMLLERWNTSYSYELFYRACAPNYCSYSENTRSRTFFEVFVVLISTSGGLIISWQLITPYLVKLGFKVFRKKNPNTDQSIEIGNYSIIFFYVE